MRAISPSVHVPYVPRCDQEAPPAERTTFLLKPLSVRELLQIRSMDAKADWLAPNLLALDLGLVGWTNLRRADGTAVEFMRSAPGAPASQPFLEHFDYGLAAELASAIVAASSLGESDAGKSSTPSGERSAATA